MTTTESLVVLTRGDRKATLTPLPGGRWYLWVGRITPTGDFGVYWWKGTAGSNNAKSFKNETTARRAAEKYLNH